MEVNAWAIQCYESEDKSYTNQFTYPMINMFPIDKNNNLFKGDLGYIQAKAMMFNLYKQYLNYGYNSNQFNKRYRLKQIHCNLVEQTYEKGYSYSYSHTLIPEDLPERKRNEK